MNTAQLQELEAIIKDTLVTDNAIDFRNRSYAVTAANKTETLTNILYNECYARKMRFQNTGTLSSQLSADDTSFIEQLSAANASGIADEGWIVTQILRDGCLQVYKAGITKTIAPQAYRLHNNPVNISSLITVTLPLEDRTVQKGFYYVFSNQPFLIQPNSIRVYWNLTSEGAPVLVRAITTLLNKYRLPFLFKCLNHPALYHRRDSCVLYLEHRYYHIFKWLLPKVYELIKDYTEPDVPLFTKSIADGVGVAEHPLNNESFGLKMMKILAAFITGAATHSNTTAQNMEQVKKAFADAGICPDNPFLNKGSKNNFS